jgi:hypothetical protein
MPQIVRRHENERGRANGEEGQALVEFALVLPLLLILVFGVIDLGKALGYKNDLTNLANQAARAAAVNNCPGGPTCTDIATWIRDQAPSEELKNGTTGGSISPPGLGTGTAITFEFIGPGTDEDPNYCIGDPVKATVTVTYNFLPFLLKKPLDVLPHPSWPLTSTATMRLEKPYHPEAPADNDYTATNLQPGDFRPCP